MSAHTPGPWTLRMDGTGRLPYNVEGNGYAIALIVWDEHMDSPQDEPPANARLIAAAPALLEALEALMPHAFHGDGAELVVAREKARAAIRLARGGDNG